MNYANELTPSTHKVKTALISVSDKFGIQDFARALHELGITLLSTGGTAALLSENNIPTVAVSELTGFPEIMNGRVKTLHPLIHGGLLAELNNPSQIQDMKDHDIESIDLVIANLYPFEQTLQRAGSTHEDIIENIDIGGPAMVRSAAKNYKWTAVVVNPERYREILSALRSSGTIPESLRLNLASEAFAHTARYDAVIAEYFAKKTGNLFTKDYTIPLRKEQSLRYGENPHQKGFLYGNFSAIFKQLHGKELSYNNIVDIDAAAQACSEFDPATVVIVKHTNPCGAATADDLISAYDKAFATDKISPFGGIIAVNRTVDKKFADHIHGLFAEVLIAPDYTPEAIESLRKKKDRRIIQANYAMMHKALAVQTRSVAGGMLIQTNDNMLFDYAQMRTVTNRKPTEDEHYAMMFALRVAKHVKSNAVVYAKHDRTLAIGAGQMSRVDAARIAVRKSMDAGIDLQGCAVASDAFFPFADGLLQVIEAGATAVIQPGGSVRDEEVIAAANEHNITMMFTGVRHFRH